MMRGRGVSLSSSLVREGGVGRTVELMRDEAARRLKRVARRAILARTNSSENGCVNESKQCISILE